MSENIDDLIDYEEEPFIAPSTVVAPAGEAAPETKDQKGYIERSCPVPVFVRGADDSRVDPTSACTALDSGTSSSSLSS